MQFNSTLQLKCASMSFSELLALRDLTNMFYKRSISITDPGEDKDGLIQELETFNSTIDHIIGDRVSSFLPLLSEE